jgi:hypothetical protein
MAQTLVNSMARDRPAQTTPSTKSAARPLKKVEITEENIQRIFGISMHDLFKKLAEKFGYQIED